jgi:hypothetical protein
MKSSTAENSQAHALAQASAHVSAQALAHALVFAEQRVH